MKISICLLIVYQLLILSTGTCQDSQNAIPTALSEYHKHAIKEKLFVHTDKGFYVAGEILWFKLYTVDASLHKPLDLSKVAYVEITDSGNTPLLQAKISLNKGEGDGSFYLPLTLNSGTYRLRAYTNWMKNFGAAYFFEKSITVVNVQKRIIVSAAKPANNLRIQFFPEGGNLVNNIPGKVAFKGTDQYGNGISFKGVLLDNADTLLSFKPAHSGMGSFSFTPVSQHIYKAIIQTPSGESQITELPLAYSKGYVMSLKDSADKISVVVHAGNTNPGEIYLFAHTREIIKVAAGSYLQNGKAVFVFDKKMLGDGISSLTIFNNQKQPVCERLYFKRPQNQLDIKVSTNQPLYATRRKVNINIQTGDNGLKSDSASLSMTVYRLDSLQSVEAAGINTYLLLTSDLKGFVEDPGYYFLNDDPQTNTDLDNVMLTNGWRRFKWEDILKNDKPFFDYIPEYNGPIIMGTVVNTKTGKPANGIESFMSVPGFQNAFSTAISDSLGKVRFEVKNYYGSQAIILQPNGFRDSIFRIDVVDPFSNDFSGTPLPPFSLQQNIAKSLLEKSISMQVQNIYSGKKVKHFLEPNVDSAAFYLTPDAKYSLDDYTRFTTLEEVLREYVILADVKKREGRFHFSLYDFANGQMFRTDPLVLLDGVPVFDLNKFMLVDPLKLKKLEVVNRKYFLGGASFDGVLNWASYKGDMADYDPGIHATIIDYDGLQMEREFYAPVYAYDYQQSSHLPDFRNVLLWSPHIKIAAGGSKEITFYTSDLPGKYAIEVQGISKNGLCGNQVFTFSVEK